MWPADASSGVGVRVRSVSIRLFAEDHTQWGTLPQFLARIPAHLCLATVLPPRCKRTRCRGKRRGKTNGRMVRLKASLAGYSSASWTKDGAVPSFTYLFHHLPGSCTRDAGGRDDLDWDLDRAGPWKTGVTACQALCFWDLVSM